MTKGPSYTIWYFEEPDHTWTAKCMTWPGWRLSAPTLEDAREQSEPSLRAWVAENAGIHHFRPQRLPAIGAA